MQQTILKLQQEQKEAIVELESPQKVHVALQAGWDVQVKKNKAVLRGEVLATRPAQGLPDLVAPVAGKVQAVSPDLIEIKRDEEDTSIAPVEIKSLERKELLEQLLAFGVDISRLMQAETLVINALEPEPGVCVHSQLVRDEKNVLAEGLSLVKKITAPSSVLLALPSGCDVTLDGCEVFFINPVYPNSADELVIRAVCQKRRASEVSIVSLAQIYLLGEIAQTGLPCPHAVLTVGGRNYRISVGTPVQDVLRAAGLEYYPGDQVLLGGPFKGQAVYTSAQGIRPGDMAVTVVHNKDFPAIQDVACLNCGECVFSCPIGLMPNMLGRYAEFGLFEQTLKYHIHSCIECGMCSYSCPTQRPVLQYIQLAKAELGKRNSSQVDKLVDG